MPNTRANFVKGMVNDAYDYAIEKYNEKPVVFPELFEVDNSEGAYEEYTTVIGPGKLNKTAEGVTIPRTTAIEGFTVYCANFKFPVELPITNEAIDDNRKIKNFLKTWSQGLGEAARMSQEDEHADIFNYGGFTAGHDTFLNDIPGGVLTTSYGNLCYDSKPFFTATGSNRTAKHGGTYYNGVATLPLNETNIQALFKLITVTNAFDEAGKRVDIMPDVLVCQYGSDNWFTAKRILESAASVSGAHSGIQNVWKSNLRLVGWSALIDTDFWAVGVAKKGLRSLGRLPLTIDYYEDKSIDSQVVRAKIRFGRAVDNFRFWAGANYSTS